MHYAHVIYDNSYAPDQTPAERWQTAMLTAWDIYRLRLWLRQGVVQFTYMKSDGSIREARGTLCMEIIPPSRHPKGVKEQQIQAGIRQPDFRSIAYYDLDKETWRAFRVHAAIAVVRVMPLYVMDNKPLNE